MQIAEQSVDGAEMRDKPGHIFVRCQSIVSFLLSRP
jgi:hypothetical protein